MRGFLIFLAVAFPMVLLSPTSWWLVQSEVGAAPSVIIEHDGVSRMSYLGTRSPWPDWAQAPGAGPITPRSYYASAPGHPANGFGDFEISGPPDENARSIEAGLVAEGWRVNAVRYQATEPTLPPTPVTLCALMAQRGEGAEARTLLIGFQLAPATATATLFWREGPPMSTWSATLDTLPAWTNPRRGCGQRARGPQRLLKPVHA